ncbi:MAG: cytochrome c biogenesis protein CcsA [Pseudomonadota bacterium]
MSHNEPSGKALQADRILTGLLGVMIVLHGASLVGDVILENTQGLGFADVLSVIAWLLAAIGLYAMMQPGFRAVSGVVLAISALLVGACLIIGGDTAAPLSWQIKLHAILSLVAYSFLGAGSVLATASLMQDSQLRAARVGRLSTILPPLIATEQFLARLTIAGFVFLLLAVTSGFIFVDNMFAQHLTHKSVLSIAGLVIFGALVVGRQVAGWRGRRMLFFYLAGFGVLLLAYFGSKVILEVVLNRHWG